MNKEEFAQFKFKFVDFMDYNLTTNKEEYWTSEYALAADFLERFEIYLNYLNIDPEKEKRKALYNELKKEFGQNDCS